MKIMKFKKKLSAITFIICILTQLQFISSTEYEVRAMYNQENNSLRFEGRQFINYNEIIPEGKLNTDLLITNF